MFKISSSGFRAVTFLALASASAILPNAAMAAITTTNLNVSATVNANCSVSSSPVAFGAVDPLSSSDVDASGGISVTCTNGTSWSASAGVGAGSGASLTERRMTSGSNTLAYNLYVDSGRTTVWGDGSGSTNTIDDSGTGSAQSITIYGRVNGSQGTVPAGSYTDTVLVTVTY